MEELTTELRGRGDQQKMKTLEAPKKGRSSGWMGEWNSVQTFGGKTPWMFSYLDIWEKSILNWIWRFQVGWNLQIVVEVISAVSVISVYIYIYTYIHIAWS